MVSASLVLSFCLTAQFFFLCCAQNEIDQDICGCDAIGSLSIDCDSELQCECKAGVGGLKCDQCLPGYSGFGSDGCSSLNDCQCHPSGSLSEKCDDNSVCTCRIGTQGDKCDMCQDGFHGIDLGCISCPTCFDEVAIQFSTILTLYNTLLQRFNNSLSSNSTTSDGLSQELIDELASYQVLLEGLLQRAINTTRREGELIRDLKEFQTDAAVLEDLLNMLKSNVTLAEGNIEDLLFQANKTQQLFNELVSLIKSLELRVREDLGVQLLEAVMLNKLLQREFSVLVQLANQSNEVSLHQELLTTNMLQQVTDIITNATASLDLLYRLLDLQAQTLIIIDIIQNETLPYLDAVLLEGSEALASARINVPIALTNATHILDMILDISISEHNVESRRGKLKLLNSRNHFLFNLTSQLNSDIDFMRTNFSFYNLTAFNLILESMALNDEATNLLLLAERTFHFANDSVSRGNAVINEATRLLFELQRQLSDVGNFTDGIEQVIRNIELAENQSLMAENQTVDSARELIEAVTAANRAASFLEEASVTLQSAFKVAMEANLMAKSLVSQATALNNSATSFAGDIIMSSDDVNVLEQVVRDDTEAISMVSDTANETITIAANLSARLLIIKDSLTELTVELDSISFIPSDRIRDVNSTLVSLEQESKSNQVLIDSLAEQVRQLQQSADELRARYTQVQQHRNLLEDILRNVEELDCRQQFEN